MREKLWTDVMSEADWLDRVAIYLDNDRVPVGGNRGLHTWFASVFGPESEESIERNLRSFMRKLRMDSRFQFEGGPRNRTVALISKQLDVERAAQLQDDIVNLMFSHISTDGLAARISNEEVDALAGGDGRLAEYVMDQLVEHSRVLSHDDEGGGYVLGNKRLLGTGEGRTATSFTFPTRTLTRLREVTSDVNELRRELRERDGHAAFEELKNRAPLLELVAQGEGKITITELMEFSLEFFSRTLLDLH